MWTKLDKILAILSVAGLLLIGPVIEIFPENPKMGIIPMGVFFVSFVWFWKRFYEEIN